MLSDGGIGDQNLEAGGGQPKVARIQDEADGCTHGMPMAAANKKVDYNRRKKSRVMETTTLKTVGTMTDGVQKTSVGTSTRTSYAAILGKQNASTNTALTCGATQTLEVKSASSLTAAATMERQM